MTYFYSTLYYSWLYSTGKIPDAVRSDIVNILLALGNNMETLDYAFEAETMAVLIDAGYDNVAALNWRF